MQVDKRKHTRILIVEDEAMIALDIEHSLMDAGFKIAGVAGGLENAMVLIESGSCDAAIVDANLAGVSACPVGSALAARGLPFIVLSGYSTDQLEGIFPRALVLQKPCLTARLLQALDSILIEQ
jgi:DNA-binding response OmpR family regulator